MRARVVRVRVRFAVALAAVVSTIFAALMYPPQMAYRGICAIGRGIRAIGRFVANLVMAFVRGVIATPGAIWRSPLRAYRKLAKWRNWLLAKVEYLQGESQKWKTTFNILKAPYKLLLSLGFSPQAATALLLAGSTVGSGVVINETILAENSFARGDPGVYSAPLDVPIYVAEGFNTLRLDLGTTPVGVVEISDITVGAAYENSALPNGETSVIIVGGFATSTNPTFNETFLEVGHMTVDRWRCDSLALTNIEAHTLIIKQNSSDGQSISATAGIPRARAIGGGNRADDMQTTGGFYDQLKVTAASSGINGKIDRLILSNIYTRGGSCKLDRLKVGTLEILLNEVGLGNGYATKEFTVATSTVYKTFINEDNVEVSISPPDVVKP